MPDLLAAEAVEDGQKIEGVTIIYLRPDGWWVAGSGFASVREARKLAKEQLPPNVKWKVVVSDV